jgi:hypothetical protein
MEFTINPEDSKLLARLREEYLSQKQPINKYPSWDALIDMDKLESTFASTVTKEVHELIQEQIHLRVLSKQEYLKTVSNTKDVEPTVIVVGGSQLGKGMITARLIDSLKDHNHQVILVDGGDAGKLYGKEADQLVIDSLAGLGNNRFNEKMLRALSPQLETVPQYKNRKKGRNKSSFPGSGHY